MLPSIHSITRVEAKCILHFRENAKFRKNSSLLTFAICESNLLYNLGEKKYFRENLPTISCHPNIFIKLVPFVSHVDDKKSAFVNFRQDLREHSRDCCIFRKCNFVKMQKLLLRNREIFF
jgi:hypothetical protein